MTKESGFNVLWQAVMVALVRVFTPNPSQQPGVPSTTPDVDLKDSCFEKSTAKSSDLSRSSGQWWLAGEGARPKDTRQLGSPVLLPPFVPYSAASVPDAAASVVE
jgi:hypothetical protein